MNIKGNNIIPDIANEETQIVFQRHSNYDREEGILLDTEKTLAIDNLYFDTLLSNLNEEEKQKLYILFIASPTTGNKGLMRAYDTTEIARIMAEDKFMNNGIPKTNIVNNIKFDSLTKKDKDLVEPNMFIDRTGYFQYLSNKYGGINKDFWMAFEEDLEKQYRLSIAGEGPDEIVDRALHYLSFMRNYADYFHKKNTNSRLIIWSGTHYDLISPLIKQLVLKLDKKDYVGVDYNSGITINITKEGKFITSIDGLYYDLGDLDNMQLHRHF